MKSSIFIFFTIWSLVNCQSNDVDDHGTSILGLAAESFPLCPEDGFMWMTREIGRAPSVENYWTGKFYLTDYKNLCSARIELTLDNPAVLTFDPKQAKILNANDTNFRICIYKANIDVEFNVQGFQDKGFPNVVKVTLNRKQVCKNPKKIKPTLLGSPSVALSGFDITSENFLPFCGRSQIDYVDLILNAKDTKPGDWPWHIAIYSVNKNNTSIKSYRCGGSIISEKSIVTAAHCVTANGLSIATDKLLVIAGKYNLNGMDPTSQEFQVSRILVNEQFDPNNLRNDIAIIQVKDEIVFNQYIQPICLWTDYDSERNATKDFVYGLKGIVVGWGLTENDTLSERLGSAELTVVSDSECLISYPAFFQRFVYQNSFCVGNMNQMNPCNGDSGGGMAMPIRQPDNKLSYFLRGVISVSVSKSDKNVCDPDYYGVFTDVAQYTDWLRENK